MLKMMKIIFGHVLYSQEQKNCLVKVRGDVEVKFQD